MIAHAGHVLVVHPAVPARSVKDLIALARAHPGKLSFGSGGIGSTLGIVGDVSKLSARVDIVHVPYKGTVLAVADVVAGQIEIVFSDMVPALPQIRGGRLRPLAVTTTDRSPALPAVPTMIESGVSDALPTQWCGVAGPKDLPAGVVSRLNGEVGRILALPDIRQRYDDLGIAPLHTTPGQFLETLRAEIPQNAKMLAAIGLKPE